MSSTEAVGFYERMQEAERLAENAKTDLAIAVRSLKQLRERVSGLETAVITAQRRMCDGEYEQALQILNAARATIRRAG